MNLGEREDELLDTLEAVIDTELPYVLVGGWAIAAFKTRTVVRGEISQWSTGRYP